MSVWAMKYYNRLHTYFNNTALYLFLWSIKFIVHLVDAENTNKVLKVKKYFK